MSMIIEEDDFKLTAIGDAVPLFDLELLRKVNKGKVNEREEFKNEAYGIPMEAAMRRILHYRISKHIDTSDLKTYIQLYKEELNKINSLLK